MNTQSHAIITYYLVRKGLEQRSFLPPVINTVLFCGALAPDFHLYIFFGWYTAIQPVSQQVIWEELYFRHDWQVIFDLFHSLPMWIAAGLIFRYSGLARGALFCLAAGLSALQDFLVHHGDAHAHFYPFSKFRFQSPVSYWNPEHYGQYFSIIEIVLSLAAGIWTYRRLQSRWGRVLLVTSLVVLFLNYGLWSFILTYF